MFSRTEREGVLLRAVEGVQSEGGFLPFKLPAEVTVYPASGFNESLELTGTFSWMPVTAEGGLLPEGEYDEQSFEARFDFQLSGIESRIETRLFMGQGSQQRGLKNG